MRDNVERFALLMGVDDVMVTAQIYDRASLSARGY
jgi:hypothetical protein